jgi:peroxiredoxin Q/BCP
MSSSFPNVGQPAPAFSVTDETGKPVSLSDFLGSYVVLYFYPKDDTPGCTSEAWSFRDYHDTLTAQGIVVLGASRDDALQHKKFIQKYNLTFPLLVDQDGSLCAAYGTWGEKSMYGKTYMGVSRTTFLIDPKGVLFHIITKVSVETHAKDVEAIIKAHRAEQA